MDRPEPADIAADLVPLPEVGRRFTTSRRVRLADADATGRLRLDAVARLLQDVGNDDFADAGLDPGSPWVARRTAVAVEAWPRLGERVQVTTWCGGLGSRWAERRSTLTGAAGGRVDVASLWVHLSDAGRPTRLPDWFLDTYGEAALGRVVSSRLSHPAVPVRATGRPWAVRATDLDVLGHVNNAATWAAVEDELWRRGAVPQRAELEYHAAIDPTDDVILRVAEGSALGLWLTAGAATRASARVAVGG
ncbi:MAG TPA: acyl-ACP thioesterase domain-containing protein [Acidimicrobiales bacterium]|nr:acyl-ACP thioesterase domain-containing protein [Acidimicrobiales bacterium]